MTKLYRDKYRIKSTRLPEWDYASNAHYFVTICTKDKKYYFGKIINREMQLNRLGEIVKNEWLQSEKIRSNIILDEFIIMPNHLHGIIIIKNPVETPRWDVSKSNYPVHETPHKTHYPAHETPHRGVSTAHLHPNSIGSIIGQFKSIVTKTIRQKYPQSNFTWQPRFHDHIIRSERSWFFMQEYIINNPMNWEKDKLFMLKS